MTIVLNGIETDVAASALDQILGELGYGGAKIATAVNGNFVPLAMRPETALHPGDRLEVIAPLQGG
ncbi:MAG: sulfur carrier protein ThiS [Pseudomonadota bacterium]